MNCASCDLYSTSSKKGGIAAALLIVEPLELFKRRCDELRNILHGDFFAQPLTLRG